MQHLWTHGYPVPQVFDADGPDLVMERVSGATMLDRFARQPWKLRSWARMLARLAEQLTTVPLPAIELAEPYGPGDVLVHGDLHPDNVLLAEHGPIVIDWPNTAIGPRGAEVANSWVIMATSEVDGSRPVRALQNAVRSVFVNTFLEHAGREEARPLLPIAAEHRLADRNLRAGEPEEIRRLLSEEGFA